MRADLKNKSLNNSMQNPSLLNLDDINKAIELTRFNVSKKYILKFFQNNIEN